MVVKQNVHLNPNSGSGLTSTLIDSSTNVWRRFFLWYKTTVAFQCGTTTDTHRLETAWQQHDKHPFLQKLSSINTVFILCMIQTQVSSVTACHQPQWRVNIQPATILAKKSRNPQRKHGGGVLVLRAGHGVVGGARSSKTTLNKETDRNSSIRMQDLVLQCKHKEKTKRGGASWTLGGDSKDKRWLSSVFFYSLCFHKSVSLGCDSIKGLKWMFISKRAFGTTDVVNSPATGPVGGVCKLLHQ